MSTWVFGDVHGCYDDFIHLLSHPEIKEEDTVILIGDIIDRGPDSFKMIKWAMENVENGGKYQMICGNHEDNVIDEFCRIAKIYGKEALDRIPIEMMDSGYGFEIRAYEAGFKTVGSILPIVHWFSSLPLVVLREATGPGGEQRKYVIAHAWYALGCSRDTVFWYRDVDPYTDRLAADYKPSEGERLIHGICCGYSRFTGGMPWIGSRLP